MTPLKPKETLILIYSTTAKLLSILSAGLKQYKFNIIETDSDRMANVKANQYRPAITIIDLGGNKDNLKIVGTILNSNRTKNIPVVLIGNEALKNTWESYKANLISTFGETVEKQTKFVVFPFKFTELLESVNELLGLEQNPYRIGEKELQEVDEKFLFTNKNSIHKKLAFIHKNIKKQWAFPYTVFKALNIAKANMEGCKQLGKCINTDSAASSAILKVANTVFYAKSSGKFHDVVQSVVRIGFRETRNLLSSMTLIEMSSHPDTSHGFRRSEFWLHSLSSALISEKLCKKVSPANANQAFITALVHDIGKIPLDNSFARVMPILLDRTTTDISPFHASEKKLIGFDHGELGKYLMSHWNFPDSIKSAVGNHHVPAYILNTKKKEELIVQACTFTANIFSKALSIGHSCDQVLPEIPKEILRVLDIPEGPSDGFFSEILKELDVLIKYLEIASDRFKIETTWPMQQTSEVNVISNRMEFFHPVILALKNNGYRVNFIRNPEEIESEDKNIIIHFPHPDKPLDFSFDDRSEKPNRMEIFFVGEVPAKDQTGSTDAEKEKENKVNKTTTFFSVKAPEFRVLENTITKFLHEDKLKT